MRIALIGDIHAYSLFIAPWHLLSKRVLGQANLWLNRRSRLDMALLPEIVKKIQTINPDLVLSTGDMTTTALGSEFKLAKNYISTLLNNYQTVIVPGNHDRYTFTATRTKRFEKYFPPTPSKKGQAESFNPAASISGGWGGDKKWGRRSIEKTSGGYPHHLLLAPKLHLIALDGTRANFIFDRGKIGKQQLEKLAALLQQIDKTDRLIVLCHYTIGTPPGKSKEKPTHKLIDQDKLIATLADGPNEIFFLHGHVHRPWCWRVNNAPNITAINAGAPALTCREFPHGQGFWQIDLSDDDNSQTGPPVQLTRHVIQRPDQWAKNCIDTPPRPPGS